MWFVLIRILMELLDLLIWMVLLFWIVLLLFIVMVMVLLICLIRIVLLLVILILVGVLLFVVLVLMGVLILVLILIVCVNIVGVRVIRDMLVRMIKWVGILVEDFWEIWLRWYVDVEYWIKVGIMWNYFYYFIVLLYFCLWFYVGILKIVNLNLCNWL